MAKDISKIQKVSASTRNAVARKSAQTLPNRPSEQGYSAEEIKRRFYQPILDAANSAFAEIDRVIEEANGALLQVEKFIDGASVIAPYKRDLDASTWVKDSVRDRYEFDVTCEMHGINDFREISADMYLIDTDGQLISVNNYEIFNNGTVRLYNDILGSGFVTISRNRDGFVRGDILTDADHIVGLAKVGKTNNYIDLDSKPNLEQITSNEIMLTKIISGEQIVSKASSSVTAQNAQYATTAGNAASATNATSATRAMQDGSGANIQNVYAKQAGAYYELVAGKAVLAEKANADEDNLNIKLTYAKQNGNYQNATVGNATRAVQDEDGNSIKNLYAKRSGTYEDLVAGKANALSDNLNSIIDATYLKVRSLHAGDTVKKSLASNVAYSIIKPSSVNNLIVVQGYITCGSNYWVNIILRQNSEYAYALYWIPSVNGVANISYGFINLGMSLSYNELIVSGHKVNQYSNNVEDSSRRANECHFTLDSVYEIINSNK